mgnify:CR=1 FL=1
MGLSTRLNIHKVAVKHPRLRGPDGEIPLKTYTTLKAPGSFSEELLTKVLRGISLQRYNETVIEAASCLWGLARYPVRPYSGGYNTEA